ncbi:unnamed protein product [Enterobius vermicularis]|uniref:Putative hydroxypyruvate isomerase n=1 Tax=Enterobius vermicularis TaxID=51028 RepID=A0A0N4VGH0_ENTVE|nr:unnamed protein product [Enterobius vermicularis]
MRVAANLSTMFQKVELLKRYEKAASLGFKCVEVSFPYSVSAEELRSEADRYHLQHILINAPTGDMNKGFRGIACLAEHKAEFAESIETAVRYANTLGCKKIHVMAGIAKFNETTRGLYVENLCLAAERFAKDGILCLIEPINPVTMPGYFLHNYDDAVAIIEEINKPNLKIMLVRLLVFIFKIVPKVAIKLCIALSHIMIDRVYTTFKDVFHAQQICGNLGYTIKTLRERIGHIQVAQVPERHEPDTDGEINYDYVFRILKECGSWDIGCEYMETSSTEDSLRWVQKFNLCF